LRQTLLDDGDLALARSEVQKPLAPSTLGTANEVDLERSASPRELWRQSSMGTLHPTPGMLDVPPQLPGLTPTGPLREIGQLKEVHSGSSSDLPDNMRFMI
jgi:hypothetical protein